MADTVLSDWTKLGALVRTARNERGWTQVETAQRAGVSRAWIARLESGHRRAELESILRLSTALDLRLLARASDSGDVSDAPEAGRLPNLIAAEAAVAKSRSAAADRRQQAWQEAAQVARSPGGGEGGEAASAPGRHPDWLAGTRGRNSPTHVQLRRRVCTQWNGSPIRATAIDDHDESVEASGPVSARTPPGE